MEKSIPTKTVEIEKNGETLKVDIYQWLTQEEENKYNGILGSNPVEQPDGKIKYVATPEIIASRDKHLFESLVKGIAWDEFNQWHPTNRTPLLDELLGVVIESYKKK
jgi:hypothetical protein